MKKFLSMTLAMLLIFSVMSPITAFAENGPFPFDPESEDINLSELSTLSIMDLDTYEMAVFYPEIEEEANTEMYPGASYDLETNTLTLDNVKSKTAILSALEMGDDFKIKLIGYNELAAIISEAETRGASITIIGDGELVLNRDAIGCGIVINAGETASALTIEETVKFKAYGYDLPTISVFNSAITDTSEVIKLGGTVVCDKPEFETYTVNVYEQVEAYDLEWNYYDWYELGLEKDGVYYIADEEFDENTYDSTGKYWVYAVTYDELLDCYVTTEYADGKGVSLDGFTVLTEYEPIYDGELGFYIGYTDYPDEYDESYKYIFDPYEKEPFDLCIDENGTKYGFWEYIEYDENDEIDEVETYVYNLIDHPTYGYVAIYDETRDSLDGLTPLKIGEKDLTDIYYYSDVIINNGGSVVEPGKIKNLKASNTNQGVKISWSANSAAEKYRIYRKAEGDEKWTRLETVAADKTSFIDKTAKSGKKYTYNIKGVNFVGAGEFNSKGATVTFFEAPDVTIKNISTGINLKWAKVAGATKYRIYRKTAGSDWTLIDTVKGTSFTDKTAKSGKKYYYRVRAGKSDTMSGYNEVSKYFLSAPKLSSIQNTRSGVKVSWKEVNGADRYKVYRKHGDGSYEYIGTTEKTYYTDTTGNSGRVYTYTVKAAKSQTNSVYNKTGLQIRYVKTTGLNTPENLKDGVMLYWQPAERADTYYIYRKVDGESSFKKIATVSPDELEKDEYGQLVYVDKTAKNGTTYAYNIKVGYKGKTSAFCNAVGRYITRMEAVDVTAATATNDGIKIKWEKSAYATQYMVLRKESGAEENFSFYYLTDNGKTTTYLDNNVEAGKTYTYAIQAIHDESNGKGGWSAIGGSKSAKAK